MNFILYFVFRTLFMRLEAAENTLILYKGLVFRRIHKIPASSILRITVRRTLPLRILRIKSAELFTLNGRFKLYLHSDEEIPFGTRPERYSKPSFKKTAFGAFIDVRALGAVALFAAVLRRIGAIFGGKYLDDILKALDAAAVNVEQALAALRVYVPKAAAVIAVFALAAWVFAFLRKLAALSRFRVGRSGDFVAVTSGVITLYEHILVRNSAALIFKNSPISLALKHCPVYLRGVMIYPCAAEIKIVPKRVSDGFPKRVWFAHCIAPLTWGCGFAALLIIIYVSKTLRGALLLRTGAWCGLFVSLYSTTVYLYYMKYSALIFRGGIYRISARRFTRFCAVVFVEDIVTSQKTSQSPFQRRSGLCDLKIYAAERFGADKIRIRHIPKDDIAQY